MISLGLNAAFLDSSAAIVVDGVPVAAAEEERFSRIRHAKRPLPFTAWELPFHAIDFCLARAGVTLDEVDHVAYSFDPRCFLCHRGDEVSGLMLPMEPCAHSPGVWEDPWDPLFAAYVINTPRQLAEGVPHHLRARFERARSERRYRWHFLNHHLCHQASAFLCAPFERCAVLTLDGRGERASTSYGVYRDGRYRVLGEVTVPHSLGLLCEQVTEHLGFQRASDEQKVTALATQGRPRFRDVLAAHIHVGENGQYSVARMDLAKLLGPARAPNAPIEALHFDIAASLQTVLEESVLRLAAWLRETTGETHLAMAGGVAMNCAMNARLRDSGMFEDVWVQPAAGDAGTSLGAALWVDAALRAGASAEASSGDAAGTPLAPRRWRMEHAYLGPGFDDEAVESQLRHARLPYRRMDDPARETAELLARDQLVGWFNGRMEFGPHALGARSILASPLNARIHERLQELSQREDFRSMAPALPAEAFPAWFAPAPGAGLAPFTSFTHEVLAQQASRIPGACRDGCAGRVLAIDPHTNPAFHALLHAFGERTGVPVLVNTSFSACDEPIVCSPRDAIEAFFSTPLDALSIGSFLVRKNANPDLHP
jgi:carbamoyltransferase